LSEIVLCSKYFFMPQPNLLKTWNTKIRDWIYQSKKIWKIVWPISWSEFKNYNLVKNAVIHSNYSLRTLLGVCVAGTLISTFFLFQGFYLILTVDASVQGGTFNEAIFSLAPTRLNPILTANNDTERKIIDLIYKPLYRISYPDYLKESKKEPIIEPVLLKSEPTWVESDKGKSLKFELKSGLEWSDGDTEITSDDVAYSFARLKESQGNDFLGNSDFSDVVQNYNIRVLSKTEFLIDPTSPKYFNPQLKYLLNFYPISQKYFESKSTSELSASPKSILNEITSGDYTLPAKISIDNKEVNNSFKDPSTGIITVVLNKNQFNKIKPALIDKYIVKIYPDLLYFSGDNVTSIQKASNNKKVDLYSRFLSTSLNNVSSDEIKTKFNLNQKIVPTNTYYTLYSNTQANQTLINQGLRKYTLCSFENFTIPSLENTLETINPLKKILPIQFGEEAGMECNNVKNELLSQKKGDKPVYIEDNGKIILNGEPISLNILSFDGLSSIIEPLQKKLSEQGLESTVTLARDNDDLDNKIKDKQYNLVLLPTTLIGRDIFSIYGSKSRNISSINKNNRMGVDTEKFGEGVDNAMRLYSESNLEDAGLKSKLIDIFKKEYISVNLFRANFEYNYSNKVYFSNAFDNLISFAPDIYNQRSNWYVETKRKFRWES
jgi:Bacterial extracellular solute-binding proteins, family 5 Middle